MSSDLPSPPEESGAASHRPDVGSSDEWEPGSDGGFQARLAAAERRNSRGAELVWWIALIVLLSAMVYLQAMGHPSQSPQEQQQELGGSAPGENAQLILLAKYTLGTRGFLDRLPGRTTGPTQQGTGDRDSAEAAGELLVSSFGGNVTTPRERLAAAVVLAELGHVQQATEIISGEVQLASQTVPQGPAREDSEEDPFSGSASGDENFGGASSLLEEARLFEGLVVADPPILPDALGQDRLLEKYGWFARLALARTGDGVQLEEIRAQAQRLAVGLIAAFVGGIALLGLGTALLGWAAVGRGRGQLRSRYERDHLHDGPAGIGGGIDAATTDRRVPYLETVPIFIVALQVVGGFAAVVMMESASLWPLMLNWLVLPVIFWPAIRGRRLSEILAAIGWTGGDLRGYRSIFREAGYGLIAYVACLPILALGLLVSMALSAMGETEPYHPVVDWIGADGSWSLLMIYVVAVVWAPIVEESVFRGAFYHYLRGRLAPLGSALVVGTVFAALHPQGWVGLPFLISLAVSLALAREWRGSIWASVTMHMVHNGLAVTAMAMLFR